MNDTETLMKAVTQAAVETARVPILGMAEATEDSRPSAQII